MPSSWVGRAAQEHLKGKQKRLVQMESWVGVPETGTKWIPLTRGQVAIVDEEDYEFLNQWNWTTDRIKNGYATTKTIGLMHRFLLKVEKGVHTDHINHNRLDNRKCNLRICTQQQNQFNKQKGHPGQTSSFKGVSAARTTVSGQKKFTAHINFNWKTMHLGTFNNEIEAAKAYNNAANKYFGEFALLNQI